MESFTSIEVLRSFANRAEGSFSYLYLGMRFTESMSYHPSRHHRVWSCMETKGWQMWHQF